MAASTSHSVFIFSGADTGRERIINQRSEHASIASRKFHAMVRDATSLFFLVGRITSRGEQDGHRGASAGSSADERRLRCFPREQRQGLHHLRRSNGRQRDHDVHARYLEGAPADPRLDGASDDRARRACGANHHQRSQERHLLCADDHLRGERSCSRRKSSNWMRARAIASRWRPSRRRRST